MIEYQWRTVLAYLPDYLHAAVLALRITVVGFVLAFVLASSPRWPVIPVRGCCAIVAGCYVEVIRNTPVLLQIFIVYFAFPSLGIRLSAVAAGTIALGVNVGAYLTEVVRAGFSSVGTGTVGGRPDSRAEQIQRVHSISLRRRHYAMSIRRWSTT